MADLAYQISLTDGISAVVPPENNNPNQNNSSHSASAGHGGSGSCKSTQRSSASPKKKIGRFKSFMKI